MTTTTAFKSFKVAVRESAKDAWVWNAKRFASAEEAHDWADDTFGRWKADVEVEVWPSKSEPAFQFAA